MDQSNLSFYDILCCHMFPLGNSERGPKKILSEDSDGSMPLVKSGDISPWLLHTCCLDINLDFYLHSAIMCLLVALCILSY
jgi:hypothetical protein